MDRAAVLAGLDDQQRRAVTSPAAPLAVVAPAGSGKTRVLTRRVAHRLLEGSADPRHVLCVTFTRKAAAELAERLRALGIRDRIAASTFHAAAWAQLREHAEARQEPAPVLVDHPVAVVRAAVPELGPAAAEVAGEIAWAKARLADPGEYPERAAAAGRRTRVSREVVADAYARYEGEKRRRRGFDFEDLLLETIRRIQDDTAFADALRWRIRHLFVDEFQDVNPLQFALLEAWRADRWDVFVVGDPHQSIYGWNGAEPRLLDELHQRWPALETIELTRSHRSSPQIIAGAAAVIDAAGLADRHPEATGPGGPAPRIVQHPDPIAELDAVASAIRSRRDGACPWRSFAVLARTRAQVDEIDAALRLHGIPTAPAQAGEQGLTRGQRLVVRALAGDDRPLLLAVDVTLSTVELGENELDELVRAAERLAEREPGATGRRFAAVARDGLDTERPPTDAVAVATFHAAKGLEWPVVHLVGVEDGFVPIRSARRRDQRAEEARLLYVAVTRAAEELTIHWSRIRPVRGRTVNRERSPFLAGFEEAVAVIDTPSPVDVARRHLDALRDVVTPPEPADPLALALDRWRADRARTARTAPEVVLPDRSLVAIAERRPTTVDELAAIPGLGASRASAVAGEVLAIVAGEAGVNPGPGGP